MHWLGFFYFTISCGHLIWRATIYNYGIEEFEVEPDDISYLFSIGAIPGLLTIALGFLVQRFTLLVVLVTSYLLIGAGLIVIGQSAKWETVGVGVLLLNLGLAVVYPMSSSFCLNRSPTDQAAITLGSLKSLGPAAALVTVPLMLLLTPVLSVRPFLLTVGGIIIGVGMLVTPFANHFGVMHNLQHRFRFRGWLIPFYVLNFLNGSRSALFKTFVIIFLVQGYGLEIGTTAGIVTCGYIINCIGYLFMGPFVQSFGHGKVLQCIYLLVALLFFGFSVIESKFVLIVLYLADSFLFCTTVATDAYLKSNCANKDYVSQLSAGVTLFYCAGFIMPVFGAILWRQYDYHGPFALGIVLAVISIFVSQRLDANFNGAE